MILPSGTVPLAPGYVASLSRLARYKNLHLLLDSTIFGPVLLVDREVYYPAVAQVPCAFCSDTYA